MLLIKYFGILVVSAHSPLAKTNYIASISCNGVRTCACLMCTEAGYQ